MEHNVQNQVRKIQKVRDQIYNLGVENQQETIRKLSPYSEEITAHIRQYEELRLYHMLELRESNITRPAILQDIDFDLWISSEGCSNLSLMQKGNAPYMYDAPEGKIELHHIGQNYNSPFAELTLGEHNENSQLLHISREQSWRSDKKLEKEFFRERSVYWKKRARKEYIVDDRRFEPFPVQEFPKQQEYLEELRKTCEAIYSQCDADDLDYLSDLAKSYAMMHRIGATTMSEFLKNTRETHQTAIHCSSCKSSDYVLYGTYQTQGEKIQRYKCRQCGKVFTALNKSLVSGSSFSFREWVKFIDCLYNGYTIKQIVKTCDISERTAHDNRTKLFYALKLLNDKVQLEGNIVLDETYLPVSYKGNHSKQDDFVMPRAANERGGENHTKGISKNLACIVCAVDDFGNSIAKVAGTGTVSAAKLKYVLKDHLGADVYCLYSDKSKTIRSFAESCGYEIKQEKLLKKGKQLTAGVPLNRNTFIVNRYLQVINSYHSRLKKFLNRFAGISTKYLSGYLYLFSWKERNKDREPEEVYRELLRIMTEPDHYLSVEDIMKDGHIPDAISINERYRKRISDDPERDKEVYRRYAAGETMTKIAADYGVTKQWISLIVNRMRKNGMAYQTEKEIQLENTADSKQKTLIRKDRLETLKRDYKIYEERLQWQGSSNDFILKIEREYCLSKNAVKCILSQMKRIHRLKEEIFIYEDISYKSLKEVYQSVYASYMTLKEEKPDLSLSACSQKLAEEYNFTQQNILRIIHIMQDDSAEVYLTQKRKLTTTETFNRDKAVFIDYLRWTGQRKDFWDFAMQKYNLSYKAVTTIVKLCIYAIPERKNLA